MKKKLTVSKAKQKAWKAFSLYIRTRDSNNGQVVCFTCDFVFPLKETQASHFVPGRHNAVLFDERNCHAACYRCNVLLSGNLINYYPKMVAKYGLDTIEELKDLDRQTKQFKVFELVEIEQEYTQKLKDLLHT